MNADPSAAPLLFLSHSGEDAAIAARLRDAILDSTAARTSGLEVWLDSAHLGPGRWQAQLGAALMKATAFAVLIGKRGLSDTDWVAREIEVAQDRAARGELTFIPVKLDPSVDPQDLPPFLRQYQVLANPLEDERAFTDLLSAATQHVGASAVTTLAPFVGLRAMREDDQHLFFGRDAEIDELIGRLRGSEMVAVVSDSGSGKSSLVRAGLTPAWRRGALDASTPPDPQKVWHVVTMRPGGDPIQGLLSGLDDAAQRLGLAGSERQHLRRAAATLEPRELAFALACDLPSERTETLLIVDQCEELLTLTPAPERQAFADTLVALATQGTRVRVVLTIRSDYFNRLSGLHQIADCLAAKATSVMRLRAISDAGLTEIIARPLTLAGYGSDAAAEREKSDLVAQISSDMEGRPGDLALIQIALAALWQESGHGRTSLITAYGRVGGVFGALAHGAKALLDRLDDAGKDRLVSMFVRLIQPGEAGGATRRIATLDEFLPETRSLAQFVASDTGGRLVLIDDERVEIAHEALIRQWSWLEDRLQPDRARIRVLHRLITRAGAWAHPEKHRSFAPEDLADDADVVEPKLSRLARRFIGPDRLELAPLPGEGLLTRGHELALFRGLVRDRPTWLSQEEHSFVVTSDQRQARDREHTADLMSSLDRALLRVSRILAAFVLVCAGFGIVAWLAFQARQEAIAQSRSVIAGNAELALKAQDYTLAGALALAALPNSASETMIAEARAALVRAAPHLFAPGVISDRGRSYVQFLGEQDEILVGSEQTGLVRCAVSDDAGNIVLDCTPLVDSLFSEGSNTFLLRTLAVSKDGSLAAFGSRRGGVQVWNLKTVEAVAALRPADGDATADIDLFVRGSKPMVAVAQLSSPAQVWRDAGENGTALRLSRARSLAFARSGALLFAGTFDGKIRTTQVDGRGKASEWFAHDGVVVDVASDPKRGHVISIGSDSTARLWATVSLGGPSDGQREPLMSLDLIDEPRVVALSPNASLAAVGFLNGMVRIYDLTDGSVLALFDDDQGAILSVDFSSDGRFLAMGTRRGAIVRSLPDLSVNNAIAAICGRLDETVLLDVARQTGRSPCAAAQMSLTLWPRASNEE